MGSKGGTWTVSDLLSGPSRGFISFVSWIQAPPSSLVSLQPSRFMEVYLSIAVKRLTSCINIFTDEDICFTITEFAMVKNAYFHHFSHLLSWNQKNPPFSRRALYRSRAYGYRMKEARVPAPYSPMPERCPTRSPTLRESNTKNKDPWCSL